ncbi:MAG: ABC transporter permease [Gemmatimonadaceae bacterium]
MPDFRIPPLDHGERFYRALLYLYPAKFRRAFERDLIEAFRDQRRSAAPDLLSSCLFWMAIAHDILTQAIAERAWSCWPARTRRPDRDRTPLVAPAPARAFRIAELRFAVRRLWRARAFTAATALMLSLGIGTSTAVFSVVNGVLLRPLPYAAPEKLVALTNTVDVSGARIVDQSDASLLLYQSRARALTIGAWRDRDVNVIAADGPGAAHRVSAAEITSNLFDILGAPPLVGRGLRRGEDRIGAAPVVVLSYRFWQRRLGGLPAAIGRRIMVDGVTREVVGVMPRTFVFPRSAPELWMPIPLDSAHANAGSFDYRSIGRLRRGATIASARRDLEHVLPRILDEYPSGIPQAMWARAHVRPQVTSLRDAIVGDTSHVLWILLAIASLVLFIACANVGNLFLVRSESRQSELALRVVVGCDAGGIVATTMSESLILSFAGGLGGVIIAMFGAAMTRRCAEALGVPRLDHIGIDIRVLAFAIAASMMCAVFVGVIPALRGPRVPTAVLFRDLARGVTSAGRQQHTRNALVSAQVAVALVLVVASGLLARSFVRLRNVEPGFSPPNVMITRLLLPKASYQTAASRARFYARLLEHVRSLPNVRSASMSDWIPLTSDRKVSIVGVADHPSPPNAVPRVHVTPTVDRLYFKTMGVPLLAGRVFDPPDSRPSTEAIVSRAFAERYWPGRSALGERIRPGISGPWFTVVGEVGDVHYASLDTSAEDAVYLPMFSARASNQEIAPQFATLLVRSAAREEVIAAAVTSSVRAIDPSLPTYDQRSLSTVVASASSRARATLVLLAVASLLALIIGVAGIYGVMSYGVALRRREIGVRITLGACPSQVSRMIARQGLAVAFAGVSLGTIGAYATMPLFRGLLFDVSPTDPLTFGVTCVAVFGLAALASWAPARRAAAVDPVDTLRGI